MDLSGAGQARLVDKLRAHVLAGEAAREGGSHRRSMGDALGGRSRTRSMGDYEPVRNTFSRSRRSSFSEIVIQKYHQPHRERRDSFVAMTKGGVDGSLEAWELNPHMLLWRSLATRGNLILDSAIRALHRCASLRVSRLGPGGDDGAAEVLEDDERAVEMVCVLKDFDVLFLPRYAGDATRALNLWRTQRWSDGRRHKDGARPGENPPSSAKLSEALWGGHFQRTTHHGLRHESRA